MTSSRNTLVVPEKFLSDFASLSKPEEAALKSLLEKLLENPYSVVKEAQASGDFFASRILNDAYLYWSLDYPDSLSLTGPLRIKLLALKKVKEPSRPSSATKPK